MTGHWIAVATAGAVLGFMISVLGGGGALFLVPVLVFGFDVPVPIAAGSSLLGILGSAAVGAIGHIRRGFVRWRVVALFGGAAVFGAPVGSRVHDLVSERVALGIFACTLLVAAAMFARPRRELTEEERARPPIPRPLLAVLGFAIGGAAGFLGTSGGFLIVPALVFGARLTLREAIGSSVAVIVLISMSGALAYLLWGALDVPIALSVGLGAMGGAVLGIPLAGRVPVQVLRVSFAGVLAVAGLYTLFRAING